MRVLENIEDKTVDLYYPYDEDIYTYELLTNNNSYRYRLVKAIKGRGEIFIADMEENVVTHYSLITGHTFLDRGFADDIVYLQYLKGSDLRIVDWVYGADYMNMDSAEEFINEALN